MRVGRIDEGMSHLILLSVPLFVFLGLLIEMTGMAKAMVDFLAERFSGEVAPWDSAVKGAKADTRNYAKRQETWFRHQLPQFKWLAPEEAAVED